ncbi:hypothetical protein [Novosphingobium sp.]|uniref:hypothetical protein n=1 Tax=Novosphingobium sp. TaxID=1874826 RepID=UPI002621C6D3|nr:hypothetical protein [Novosphingobium sp.]
MNFELVERLAAQPARLTALLANFADAEIDATVREAVEETDVFAGLGSDELPMQTNLFRVRLFAEQLLDLVDEADGTTAAFQKRRENR